MLAMIFIKFFFLQIFCTIILFVFKFSRIPSSLKCIANCKLWYVNSNPGAYIQWGRVFHSGGAWGVPTLPPPPSYNFFWNPPIKTDAPHGAHSLLKNEAPSPSKKQKPPLKSEAPFHEMIPRKSTIKSS